MPKLKEKGSALVILVVIFASIVGFGVFLLYKTFTATTKKIDQTSEEVKVALKSEYQNPFDSSTQYQNPFSDYHNPFDDLK